jgi:hypothetical protein
VPTEPHEGFLLCFVPGSEELAAVGKKDVGLFQGSKVPSIVAFLMMIVSLQYSAGEQKRAKSGGGTTQKLGQAVSLDQRLTIIIH